VSGYLDTLGFFRCFGCVLFVFSSETKLRCIKAQDSLKQRNRKGIFIDMGNTVLTITPGVLIEKVGDDLMVITPKVSEAIILSGHIADTLAAIADGETVDGSDDAVSHLVELGIVHTPGMSRRGLIAAGALGAGAGVVLLSMPAAAVSASPGTDNGNGAIVTSLCVAGDGPDVSAVSITYAEADEFLRIFVEFGAAPDPIREYQGQITLRFDDVEISSVLNSNVSGQPTRWVYEFENIQKNVVEAFNASRESACANVVVADSVFVPGGRTFRVVGFPEVDFL